MYMDEDCWTWPCHPERGAVDPWPARYIPRAALIMIHAGAMVVSAARPASGEGASDDN